MIQLRMKHLCAVLALFFGWAVLRYGFEKAILLAAAAGAGWFVGRLLDGEVDLSFLIRQRRDFNDLD